MEKRLLITVCYCFTIIYCQSQTFDSYFTHNACRVDFHFAGNNLQTTVFLDNVRQEPFWGGRKAHLRMGLNLGDYRFLVLDSVSRDTLYANGFSSLFREWQATPEAKTVSKSFEQVVQFPFPKRPVIFIVEKRLALEQWSELFHCVINPADLLIDHRTPQPVPVKTLLRSAATDHAVDIAVIAEGYTAAQRRKFYADAQQLINHIFSYEPFAACKNRFNVYAIAAPSDDSGVTIPQDSVWKNSAVGSQFYTFYEPRYLTTLNIRKIYDLAALVPYDAIYILANTSVYGGGGVYNLYALTAAGNQLAKQVTVHEFGHSFAGLADEYFYDHDALNDMYDLHLEPWEPNITTRVAFDKKWKNQIQPEIPIPTPPTESYYTTVGLFEGGGYMSKGIFRPSFNCRMRTNTAPAFCPVCRQAIEKVIRFLTE